MRFKYQLLGVISDDGMSDPFLINISDSDVTTSMI